MIFAWGGKLHRVFNYTDKTGFATIQIADVQNINSDNTLFTGTGLAPKLYSPSGTAQTITCWFTS